MTDASTRPVVRCDECRTPVAEIRPQGLVIKSRHLGTTHVTILTWTRLLELLEAAKELAA